MKSYEPVGQLEKHTSHCPLYLAWQVVDEVRDYFRKPIPDTYATTLARRAEAVFAKHPFWRRQYQSSRGRGNLLMSMRHWLASQLNREQPALFRALPESYKVGQPLPPRRAMPTKTSTATNVPGWTARLTHWHMSYTPSHPRKSKSSKE